METGYGYGYALKTQVGALCIALVAAGAFIAIPLPGSPVPVVLQNMFVVFTGLVLTPGRAFLTIIVYLVLGALGLPIFAGAAGGLAHFAGPTGGFLVGFPISAWTTSMVIRFGTARERPGRAIPGREKPAREITCRDAGPLRRTVAVALGFLVVYPPGLMWLSRSTGLTWGTVIAVGFLPFLAGDIVKAAALVALIRTLPASLWRSWT